jgi:hypothetical protein
MSSSLDRNWNSAKPAVKGAACQSCRCLFDVYQPEQELLGAMDLPCPPRFCPRCRRQRRLAFRNERRMYHRICDESGRRTVALYPQDAKDRVVMYEQNIWWDYEKMDPLSLGRDFDFSRPFFDQFAELRARVPHPSLHNTNVQNAMYGNHCVSNKDCYLTIGSDLCEDCYFTYWAIRCRSCFDCSVAYDSELCHSCVDIRICYNCYEVVNSENMHDSQYCCDCKGCHDCMGCIGLRHQEYCILNEALSREQYLLQIRRLREQPGAMEEFLDAFERLCRGFAHLATKNTQSEDVLGDRVWRSKRCLQGFDLEKCEDLNYSTFGFEGIDSQDIDFFGRVERMYEGFSAFGQYNCISTILCHYSFDTYYSEYCISCHHLFGCVSLHHNQYCILNKEYTRERWEDLVPKIIRHMKRTGEWGEFFPVKLSPFPYNITVAQKYYPLSREEILARGWLYEDPAAARSARDESFKPLRALPKSDRAVDVSICNEVLRCEKTGRPYQIMKKEFDYLRKRDLPLPRIHQDERNELRMAKRNPLELTMHSCAACGTGVASSYDAALGYRVLCQECYEGNVYSGGAGKLCA